MTVDFSSNNGLINFDNLSGVDEVFIRTSLGYGDLDKMLHTNANGLSRVGIPVSYYHFAYPHSSADPATDAAKQANYFVDTIQALPKYTHLAIDLEPQDAAGTDTSLSQEDYATWLQTFLDTVENRTGTKCIIYTYADYLNRHLPDNHAFGAYPLWIANYSNVSIPALPKGWDAAWAWQYSDSGTVAGVQTKVDLTKLM